MLDRWFWNKYLTTHTDFVGLLWYVSSTFSCFVWLVDIRVHLERFSWTFWTVPSASDFILIRVMLSHIGVKLPSKLSLYFNYVFTFPAEFKYDVHPVGLIFDSHIWPLYRSLWSKPCLGLPHVLFDLDHKVRHAGLCTLPSLNILWHFVRCGEV